MSSIRSARMGPWAPAIATFIALALLAALIVYWAMQLLAPAVTIAPSGSLVKTGGAIDTGASRRLFGDTSNKPTAKSRRSSVDVKVTGVLASEYRAAAILSIDGQPAKAYGVGEEIEEDFVVESIDSKEVVLDRDGETIRVDVPEQSNRDMAILTSGKNEDTAGTAPVSTTGSATRPNSRSRVRRPGARPNSGSRPALKPRRLPPSGAAAASAAARNTSGGAARANTPAATRPAGVGRPGPAQNRSNPPGSPPLNNNNNVVNNGNNGQQPNGQNSQNLSPREPRVGTPGNGQAQQPTGQFQQPAQ